MKEKNIIIKSIGITEMRYCTMVMEAGYSWLRSNFGKDASIVNNIAKMRLFWLWWNNQWEIRDAEYVRITSISLINEVLCGDVKSIATELYNDIHNPYHIRVIPNRMLKDEISKLLLKEIAKEEESIKMLQQ